MNISPRIESRDREREIRSRNCSGVFKLFCPAKIFRNLEIMGENEHQSRDRWWWSIDNDQGNNLEEVLEPGPDCCIYRVPQFLRNINEEAYTPKFISIGPLHYGRKELMGMENHKSRYCSKFAERVNNTQRLEEFKTYIKDQEQRIRNHYSVTSTIQSSKYVKVILRDAIFIIELFMRKINNDNKDFLLKPPLAVHVSLDLLLLENQLPYFVLDDLFKKAFSNDENHSFLGLVGSYFGVHTINNSSCPEEQPQVKHFTDCLRRFSVMEVQTTAQSDRGQIFDLPSATKLKESGLKFRGVGGKRLLDITLIKEKRGKWLQWYEVNELQIPRTEIDDTTECLFRNLMALELFHYPTQTHICNYAFFMDCLIDTTKDVDFLVEKEIIVNCVGDNEAIAKMFNSLCSHIAISDSCYYDITKKMKAHYKYPWNHAKATLKSVYFGNLWTGTATVAAAFLLILTAIQTVCSIKQVI